MLTPIATPQTVSQWLASGDVLGGHDKVHTSSTSAHTAAMSMTAIGWRDISYVDRRSHRHVQRISVLARGKRGGEKNFVLTYTVTRQSWRLQMF